jgi:hypothetical protein
MPEPRQREDESQRPNEMPQTRPNERPEPERKDPTGLPSNDTGQKPLEDLEIDVDDAQLVDPAAEPGKPV